MPVQLHTIVSMPFAENTYIVWADDRSDVVVIDPGLEPDAILDYLRSEGKTVAAILNTHGHADHIAGNFAIKQAYPDSPLIIGHGDVPLLSDPVANVSESFGFSVTSPPADQTVRDGDELDLAGLRWTVREIPGHSPGHVVFLVGDPPIVFGGDVLFRGGIGRSDFPGGSHRQLIEGIRTKLYTLPPTTPVYPGHGPVTTIGHEKASNPFVLGED